MLSKSLGTTTPHLKRGDELEIKFITVASEDMANSIQYPSFHFMKLQRPDHRAANYIKIQETKPELVVNLTEDEAFCPLFLYSIIRKPKKCLRLKVENELRLCWVLLKGFRTTVSPAAVE
ncbi:hypothetical protein ACS0TY_006820 [Phlomoides rotata]